MDRQDSAGAAIRTPVFSLDNAARIPWKGAGSAAGDSCLNRDVVSEPHSRVPRQRYVRGWARVYRSHRLSGTLFGLMAADPPYYVYVLSNVHRTVLYVGMTNDLRRRLQQHREGRASAFTTRYNTVDLVYFERHETSTKAIEREKQLKAWRREKKEALIRSENPGLETLPPPVD